MKATLFTPVVCLVLFAHHAHSFATTGFRTTTAFAPKHARSAHASHASPYSGPVLSRTAAASGHGLSMMSDDGPLSYPKKFKEGWGASIAARDPDELGPGPSKINQKSKPVQAVAFAAMVALHAAGVKGVLKGLVELESRCGCFGAWKASWAPFLGVLYAVAGLSHFVAMKQHCNIVPGKGAWGIWYLPGRASFHVKVTGVVEVLAGAALVAGWLGRGPAGLLEKAAAVLFGLTVAVTPANIYMFTHDAQFPQGKKFPIVVFAARAALQCLFLGIFWKLAMF